MFKNTAGQKITFFVFDASTGLPATGEAAHLTAAVAIDGNSTALLADQTAVENDPVNAKGLYTFNVSQAETDGDELAFSCECSTLNISTVPRLVNTELPHSAQVGPGGVDVEIISKNNSNLPIDGVEVWISTDEDGINIVAGTLVSDTSGITKFKLDDDTVYWVHRQRAGYNFSPNPEMITVGTP